MATSTAGGSCQITADGDVMEIGIRLSIYILSITGPILSFALKAPDFNNSINATIAIQGLALLFTAILTVTRNTLDLFDAICVMHLVALLSITLASKASYGVTAFQRTAKIGLQYLIWFGFLVFNIYIWAKAPSLGGDSSCDSETVYVVFGVTVSATDPKTRWSIVALTVVMMIAMFFASFAQAGAMGGKKKESSEKTKNVLLLLTLIIHLAICTYIIAMLELTIRRNNLTYSNGQWGYGQFLAMFLLVGPLIQLLSCAFKPGNDGK